MQIGSEPVAVIGDENRKMSLSNWFGWEGAVSSVIRESEDLPETLFGNLADRGANQQAFEDKKGNPQIDLSVRGFFFAICQTKEAG